MTTQSKFALTLPTQDNSGATLPPGTLTAVDFVVTPAGGSPTTYTHALTGTNEGAAIVVTFASLGFTPVGGTSYSADAFAVDANGNGVPSATVTWTELTVPAAPTGFSVA